MKQRIIFTALPAGINQRNNKLNDTFSDKRIDKTIDKENGRLKISVAISLQVIETAVDTKLSSVPDMLNWAASINQAKFLVNLNGQIIEATKTSPNADTALWQNLFRPELKVNAFVQEDKTNIPIVSYPVKHVVDYVQFIVDQTGKNFSQDMPNSSYYTENPFFTSISNYQISPFPSRGRKIPKLSDIAIDRRRGEGIKRILTGKKFIPYKPAANPDTDFAQVCHFHGLYDAKVKDKFVQFDKPDFEFHDVISVLSQYPKLMRRLGLVVDLEIPNQKYPLRRGGISGLRVFPSNLTLNTPTLLTCPLTANEITEKGFYVKAKTGSFHEKGYAKINTDAFSVFQIDTDGAALKLTSHVDALQLKKAKNTLYAFNGYMPNETFIPAFNNELIPRREGLPSQRSAGIAVAKNGMAEYLSSRFSRMNVLKDGFTATSTPPPGVNNTNATYYLGKETLYADDVNIGYRMDVKMTDKEGGESLWNSLHFHDSTYTYSNVSGNAIPIDNLGTEEGFIQLSTSEDETIEAPHMKLSEVIARWEGWSLAAPMPGLSLNEPTLSNGKEVESSDAEEAAKYKTPNTVPFKLNVKPVVTKGTLPRLRYGHTYAIKLRTVDLAGNSVYHNSTPENATSAVVSDIVYKRFEPVDAPALVHGNAIKDGESSEVMAIRSNDGQTVSEFENDVKNKDTFHTTPYEAVSTRHIKPPRSTVGVSINHSKLEQAIGLGSTEIQAVYDKIKNEKDPFVADIDFGVDPETGDDIIKHDPNSIAPVVSSDVLGIPVEYLADPMAVGVSVFVSSLDPNIKASAEVRETFAKRLSFYFDTEIKSEFDANKDFEYSQWMAPKTFRIVLQEKEIFDMKWYDTQRKLIVSVPKGFMLKLSYASFWKPKDILKLSGILAMMKMNSLADPVGKIIANGQHWMFSPWRTLTLVHAVKQPVIKVPGIEEALPYIKQATSIRNFGDTFAGLNIDFKVHGASTGVVDIEAKWIDWINDINEISDADPDGVQKVAKTAKVFHFSPLYHVFSYVFGDFTADSKNPFKALPHHFNDTKHRWIDYQIAASTRYKEYFFNLIKEQEKNFKITRESNIQPRVNILSSARPMAPQVAYVIPIFEWDERIIQGNLIRTRIPGLRIYLKKPWYSSGENEKLAVLINPKSNGAGSALLFNADIAGSTPFYTTWGSDPTKYTASLANSYPEKKDFIKVKESVPDNIYTEDNLTISEIDNLVTSVVAYDVHYDTTRHLYYADLIMDAGTAYYPFVRLALAAYQQHSVRTKGKDCCLSKVVQADYTQLLPRRATVLNRKGLTVSITIIGSSPRITNAQNFAQSIEFIIEPLNIPASEDVIISTNISPIDSYSSVINNTGNKDSFTESHVFNLPAAYATQPYCIKIFEYELIPSDPRRAELNIQGNNRSKMEKRVVFAEVYKINV